ncbi:tRNA (5-methylaminomethyl-2-thiouridine)(34)-methyltransferase MnmD [Rhodobacter sp. NTK016B]|uniref:tRNA (5-methylaminomethyl-2-thiouridine)(34)-methyltransferase MnmD n=1 Tax=Rhodobacter sp. NTK016B TaxID=2759676 RepID=UPI001A8D3797|nr:tRNA (5-methylaminomethyl-2-thiouridine)(34)-methyltransferase MnmD [Rhodobacter sp. NTK016B]MBN8292278.1 tRNA (5-methylaminomethyl-2-thiouridine)(34)-methyltransferase MnmD [Rhodobacter sp. NTK016B]
MTHPDLSRPDLSWLDGDTPVATAFDDPYFTGGLEETRHVFLQGNDLPARLRDGFRVAELGFGTGLNLLALAQIWDGPGTVHFTSFEAFPMAPADMARALKPFAQPMAEALVAGWAASEGPVRRFRLGQVDAEIRIGDARIVLPGWTDRADAWFLDGFAPARNPELWDEGLLAEVANHTRPGGTFATYTAAGHVRRALEQAGFVVSRVPGFGRKKHMSIGRIPA